MPAIARYEPNPDAPAFKANDQAFDAERTKRLPMLKKAWQYYDGDHHRHLKPDNTQTDDNVTINKVGLIADKVVGGLMGRATEGVVEGVTFDVVDSAGDAGFRGSLRRAGRRLTGQVSPSQQWLDRVWEANKRKLFQHGLALNGAICGHVFCRLVRDGVRDPMTDDPVPRIINLDPGIVSVGWDAADVERPLVYRLEYGPEKARVRHDIVRAVEDNGDDAKTGPSWRIYKYRQDGEFADRWIPTGPPEDWAETFPPIIDWQNLPRPNQYYGMSDIRGAIALNDALNFAASNFQRILKHHANPKTIGVGFKASDIRVHAGGIITVPYIEGVPVPVYNLEMQSDLQSTLSFIQMITRAIFDGARELDPASVADRLGQLTNFALRVLYADTLAKVGTKRLLYGGGFQRLNRALLIMGGISPAVRVNNQWPDPLVQNQLEQAQTLEIDRRHGVSQETFLERRGYDPLQEAERSADEAASGQAAFQQALLRLGNTGFGRG